MSGEAPSEPSDAFLKFYKVFRVLRFATCVVGSSLPPSQNRMKNRFSIAPALVHEGTQTFA
ncbi:hypothetical protein [Paraburkholderia sp. USG1]|uniref:hypothetical protein n=1 Tax=Paraburkholderia sp. USG1 TaxID=2952268 RepID=UPI0028704C26|nr:hypothetical protein [Paraburkholderia sp. USG1]